MKMLFTDLCPLCQKDLIKTDNTYHCDTYVYAHPNWQWKHFFKIKDSEGSKYIATLPPFKIYWWKDEGKAIVQTIGIEPDNWKTIRDVYYSENVGEQEILKIYKRFANLKSFI